MLKDEKGGMQMLRLKAGVGSARRFVVLGRPLRCHQRLAAGIQRRFKHQPILWTSSRDRSDVICDLRNDCFQILFPTAKTDIFGRDKACVGLNILYLVRDVGQSRSQTRGLLAYFFDALGIP